VIGARGGVGASTVAQNIAWSIAERQGQRAALVDLDLSFGSSAAAFEHDDTSLSVADVVAAGENADETVIRAMTPITKRLSLLAAPAAVESVELEPAAFDILLAQVRRSAPYVVLDLPHAWEPWVREALRCADELVLVASPDLASLRNADNMLKLLRSERDKASAPVVVLSMAGVPKRPEISLKEFGDALKAKPAMTFAFEPELFAKAAAAGRMIYETLPDAKAALQLDTLAAQLTGHEPKLEPAPRVKTAKPAPAPQQAEQPVLELSTIAPEPVEIAPSERAAPEPVAPTKPKAKPYRAARTGFLALQAPPEKRRRSTGVVRAAMALLALALAGAWYVQKQQETASRFDFPSAFSA
jgi:pilus assembly protein CpaE